MRIHPCLEIVELNGTKSIRCCRCGHLFCSADQNYKEHALLRVRDLAEAGRRAVPEGREPLILYQEFYCPGCTVLLEVDAYCPELDADDPIVWDIQIDLSDRDEDGSPFEQ